MESNFKNLGNTQYYDPFDEELQLALALSLESGPKSESDSKPRTKDFENSNVKESKQEIEIEIKQEPTKKEHIQISLAPIQVDKKDLKNLKNTIHSFFDATQKDLENLTLQESGGPSLSKLLKSGHTREIGPIYFEMIMGKMYRNMSEFRMFHDILLWGKFDHESFKKIQSRAKIQILYKENNQKVDLSVCNLYYIVWEKEPEISTSFPPDKSGKYGILVFPEIESASKLYSKTQDGTKTNFDVIEGLFQFVSKKEFNALFHHDCQEIFRELLEICSVSILTFIAEIYDLGFEICHETEFQIKAPLIGEAVFQNYLGAKIYSALINSLSVGHFFKQPIFWGIVNDTLVEFAGTKWFTYKDSRKPVSIKDEVFYYLFYEERPGTNKIIMFPKSRQTIEKLFYTSASKKLEFIELGNFVKQFQFRWTLLFEHENQNEFYELWQKETTTFAQHTHQLIKLDVLKK